MCLKVPSYTPYQPGVYICAKTDKSADYFESLYLILDIGLLKIVIKITVHTFACTSLNEMKPVTCTETLYPAYLRRVPRKPVFRVSDQVLHKPGCTAREDG